MDCASSYLLALIAITALTLKLFASSSFAALVFAEAGGFNPLGFNQVPEKSFFSGSLISLTLLLLENKGSGDGVCMLMMGGMTERALLRLLLLFSL